MYKFYLLAALCVAFSGTVLAQCDNEQACNYDPEGTEPCNFNASNQDLSEGVMLGLPFGQYSLDPEADCAVQPINDNFVQMEPNAEGYMQFVIDDAVLAYFEAAVADGLVTQEQADQFLGLMTYSTFAFCGDDMTVNLPGLGVVEDTFEDGHWFLGSMIGYYVAPIANAEPGCGDPEADNFDLCAIPDESLCTYPPVMCNDPLACNYEAGSEGADDCVYFDTDNFSLGENDFIGLYEYDDCETGYAGWNDLVLPLAQDSTGGPLYFVLFDAVEQILIGGGLEILVQDLQTLTVSVCGDTLNYNSVVAGDMDFYWDGYGFENTFYGGYIAPESSYTIGCPDPEACNYDPCSHPFTGDMCEYVPAGTMDGDTIVMNGGTYTYTYAGQEGSTFNFYSACGDVVTEGNTGTLTVSSETDCELCVEETTADGCSSATCIDLMVTPASVADIATTAWTMMPNPTNNQVFVQWTGVQTEWVIFDQQGREVRRMLIAPGVTTLSLGDLATGQYLLGPEQGTKQRLSIIR